MIAVFAAMSQELAGLERRLVDCERTVADIYPVRVGYYGDKRVLLCRTGIGRRAESALRVVLARHEPWVVLSAGVGGALNPSFAVGDLVLCESVWSASSGESHAAPVRTEKGLLRLAFTSAANAGLRVWSGRSVTADRVVSEPAEKDALHRSLGLDVVEMESYWMGLVARERGLPFLAARAVLDESGDRLPELPGVVQADGSRRTLRALSYALTHPGRVPRLLRTAASERRALGSLTRFLGAFVGAFEPSAVADPA